MMHQLIARTPHVLFLSRHDSSKGKTKDSDSEEIQNCISSNCWRDIWDNYPKDTNCQCNCLEYENDE